MRIFIVTSFALLLLHFTTTAYAAARFFYITPDNLEQNFCNFKVSVESSESGTIFDLVATAKNSSQGDSKKLHASISHVDLTGDEKSITSVRTVPLQRNGSTVQATLSLSPEEMNSPNLCIVFSEANTTQLPTASFYIIRPLDFLLKEAQQDAAANP